MVVSLMIKAMAVGSWSGSWFGFQVGFGLASAAGLRFQELGQRGRLGGPPAAELVDDDQVGGTARRPLTLGVGQVIWIADFGLGLIRRLWAGIQRRPGLTVPLRGW